jgi:hypothetical protein
MSRVVERLIFTETKRRAVAAITPPAGGSYGARHE